jgi:hypothetical protein
MEYDVVLLARRVPEEQADGEEPEVSGYIFIGGGAPQLSFGGGSPFSPWSFSAPVHYSAPSFAVIHLGVSPDG